MTLQDLLTRTEAATGPDRAVDKYGNREDELRYCCFPDCGCDGARLCMAEEGPSWTATQVNLEKRSTNEPLVYEAKIAPR